MAEDGNSIFLFELESKVHRRSALTDFTVWQPFTICILQPMYSVYPTQFSDTSATELPCQPRQHSGYMKLAILDLAVDHSQSRELTLFLFLH